MDGSAYVADLRAPVRLSHLGISRRGFVTSLIHNGFLPAQPLVTASYADRGRQNRDILHCHYHLPSTDVMLSLAQRSPAPEMENVPIFPPPTACRVRGCDGRGQWRR